MAKPRASNGVERGVEEFAVPSVLVVALIGGVAVVFGPVKAGLVLIAITLLKSKEVTSKATYWNAEYTLAVLSVGAIAVFTLPDYLSQLVHPTAGVFSTFVVFCVLVYLGHQFLNKWLQ